MAPHVVDADSGLPLDVRSPAHSNGRLQIWATGLGKVRPQWPTGMPAPLEDPPAVAAQVRFTSTVLRSRCARHPAAGYIGST